MRTLLVILLGLVALSANVPATPAACSGDCVVSSSSAGYLPPVLEMTSGSTVAWTSIDIGHNNADGGSGVGSCLRVSYGPNSPSSPTRLTLTGEGLQSEDEDGRVRACTTGAELPDGSYVLPYYCTVHPLMRGVVVVTA